MRDKKKPLAARRKAIKLKVHVVLFYGVVVTAVVSPTCREVFVVNDFYDVSICHMVNYK